MWVVYESNGFSADFELKRFENKDEDLDFVGRMNKMSMEIHQSSGFYVKYL